MARIDWDKVDGALADIGSTIVLYNILKILSADWKDLPAYKLGIIDDEGKTLKKRRALKTAKEKHSYTSFHIFLFNIKRLLGNSRLLSSFALSIMLLREDIYKDGMLIQEEENTIANTTANVDIFSKPLKLAQRRIKNKYPDIKTDVWANNIVFCLNSDKFNKCVRGKKKYAKWTEYVGEDETGQAIKEYNRKNPSHQIIIKDNSTGCFTFLKPFDI